MARLLVLSISTMTSLPAGAGDELPEANSATYDASVVTLDNSIAGETTFTIDSHRTEIGWQDLQQPANNTLEFNFVDPGSDSAVLNRIGANRPPSLDGTVISNGTVAFSSPFGLFIGSEAVIDVGSLVAIGADVSRESFLAGDGFGLELTGDIENRGTILADESVALIGRNVLNAGDIVARNGHVLMLAGDTLYVPDWDAVTSAFLAQKGFFGILGDGRVDNSGLVDAQDAALIGGRVANYGEIAIADGSLMMVGADAVYLSRFDDPVFVKLPHSVTAGAAGAGGQAPDDDGASADDARYAVENHGRIDAGLGHVRLAAADPLGFGIRQGTGASSTASIRARQIELEGGETGRVHLSGTLDASDESSAGRGGDIDVTGSILVLEDATLNASGTLAGGRIHVGGEQQGGGELQRARVVVVDEASAVSADALETGNGGEVIVFAEDLTSVDGALSARGGALGGDGGFVETSGLRNFAISRSPDVFAPAGETGAWLIDPYDILIQTPLIPPPNNPNDCGACLNEAIAAILDPDFDDTAFDGILRTVDPASNGILINEVDPFLIATALAIGTDITISTQAFGVDNDPNGGDITIVDPIVIDSNQTLSGIIANLTLLAAGDINVDADIRVDADSAGERRVALNIDLRANDLLQLAPGSSFNGTFVDGNLSIDADITTGGGFFLGSGIGISMSPSSSISTQGGSIELASGTVSAGTNPGLLLPVFLQRTRNDPSLEDLFASGAIPLDPTISIAGDIDTSIGPNALEPGGNVALNAYSINVSTQQSGDDRLEIITGQLTMTSTASIRTDGGDIALSGGLVDNNGGQSDFVGNVDIEGNDETGLQTAVSIDSGGGNVQIEANRLDPNGDAGAFFPVFVDQTRNQGGAISISDADVSLGSATVETDGGTLDIGAALTRSITLDGAFSTLRSILPLGSDNGLIRLLAFDSSDPNAFSVSESGDSGQASITIGGDDTAATSLRSAGLSIESRDVTFSSAGAANATLIELVGSQEAEFDENGIEIEPIATSRQVDVTGGHQISFNPNTEIAGETILVTAAASPLTISTAERANGEVRVSFEGNNNGAPASQGVLLRGDLIAVTIGDGITPSDDGFSEPTGTLADPTDFGILRETTGVYDGLQLRNFTGATRPEELSIRQDGDLTVTDVAATGSGELYLAGAFGAAAIGASGLQTGLTSADGILTVQDSAPFDSGAAGPGDAGKSWVVLNGGLFLPDDELNPPPGVLRNSVLFGGGAAAVAFDVESLTVTTPGSYTIDDATRLAFGTTNELVVQAGRSTGVEGVAGRGTLTVEGGVGFELRATDRLLIQAAASGFGDLVFAGATLLASNDIGIRAGGGAQSENDGSSPSPEILSVQANVDFTDGRAGLNDFGGAGSTATAFSYRQDAGIDGETDLPDLDQLLTLPGAGFQTPIDYEVRSDGGTVLLDDGVDGTNEGDRFANASLALVGLQIDDAPAISVSNDFAVTGPRVSLGGVTNFTFGQQLAAAFNRLDDSLDQFTLRAGLIQPGTLSFDDGGQGVVQVKGGRVDFVAGDGVGGNFGSSIDVQNAQIVLTGERAFSFQSDGEILFEDLPVASQFAGSVLPRIFAVRGDGGSITLDEFSLVGFPVDSSTPGARVILEADTITLDQSQGGNLYLTNDPVVPDLNLRLRANTLNLAAFRPDTEGDDGRVIAGPRAGEMLMLTPGDDASFDDRSLLIEAYDGEADLATTENLSTLSEVPNNPGIFDLAFGRSPTIMTITQDGEVTEDALPDYRSISGLFARTIEDDENDAPIATTYTIQSVENPSTLKPENLENSNAIITGRSPDLDFPGMTGITFLAGNYNLDGLQASSVSSIRVQDNVSITVNEGIILQAGLIFANPSEALSETGDLVFGTGPGPITPSISLQADRILLSAGPSFVVTNPDADDDGSREPLPDAVAPRINFAGLASVVRNPNAQDSTFTVQQSASLDVTSIEGDFLKAFGDPNFDLGAAKWDTFDISSIQGIQDEGVADADYNGSLYFGPGNVATIANKATNLEATTVADFSTLVLEVPLEPGNPTVASFRDFDGQIDLDSLDITLRTSDPGAVLDLGTQNYRLIAADLISGFESEPERYRLLDDPDVLPRAIVRFEQVRDLGAATLPGGDRYFLTIFGSGPFRRTDFSVIDLVLETSGPLLSFDDALRNSVTGSNLTLISGGDIDISIGSVTPGFENLPEYADVQLASFGVHANDGSGDIRFAGSPTPMGLSLDTLGDQAFEGVTVLEIPLATEGRDITFREDITRNGSADVGLRVSTDAKATFEGDVGTETIPLAFLHVAFDSAQSGRTPNAEFGRRVDLDGDGIAETPVDSDQQIWTRDDALFYGVDFRNDIAPTNLLDPAFGRNSSANFATVGKALGDLIFTSTAGNFQVSSGEKISVGGTLTIDVATGDVQLGDVTTLELRVIAGTIGLVLRQSGITRDLTGETQKDAGSAIVTNVLDFGGLTPSLRGRGRDPRFALPDISTSNLPGFNRNFSFFEIKPSGQPLFTGDFVFASNDAGLLQQIPSWQPKGASRSELSGAEGPRLAPIPESTVADPLLLADAERLLELAVDAKRTSDEIIVARLESVAVIDDLASRTGEYGVTVTDSRLDVRDAENAIALYEKLFGPEGERTDDVRETLQGALDNYLETTRTRRVVGFELRRFVKNRPSTLLEAYTTLESLDSLFRYHRRLGLSPGEFRRIQREWLREIQPDGISLDELSEAIHPSRYVRGSDILDIFGQ